MTLDLNKPDTWADSAIHSPPAIHLKFQARIDKIFGLAENAMPIVRLVWAPDIQQCYSKFYTSWNEFKQGVDTELRAKYKYATVAIPGSPDIIDIPPPRWILEQREEPGQYAQAWEAARYDNEGRERRPPPPTTGYYSHLMTIATHDSVCCKNTPKQVVCWGKYREPDTKDLEILKRAKYLRDQDKEIDVHKPLTVETLAAVGKKTRDEQVEREMKIAEKTAEFVEDNALELIQMFTGQRLSEKTKKFSFPSNMKRKESGLIVPQNN